MVYKHPQASMKKMLFTMLILFPTIANAYDVLIDGIYYNVSSETKQAEVTFSGYSSIKYKGNITIPNTIVFENDVYSVTAIGEKAFYDNSQLNNVVFPNGIVSIGDDAFYQCRALDNLVMPESITSIGVRAFYGCSSLSNIVIGKSVYSIGGDAFSECLNLRSINIPDNVITIGYSAFKGCTSLTSIVLGEKVETIGASAFYGCTNLSSISIPDNVTSIGGSCFYECKELANVVLGKNVSEIGGMAFYKCRKLNAINIPDGVTILHDKTFQYCDSLKKIVIGKGLYIIDKWNFWACSKLENVYCFREEPPLIGEYVLGSSFANKAVLHVPSTSIDNYRTAYLWRDFGSIIALTDDDTAISSISMSHTTSAVYYSLDGVRSNRAHRGINIVRLSDGTVKKHYSK